MVRCCVWLCWASIRGGCIFQKTPQCRKSNKHKNFHLFFPTQLFCLFKGFLSVALEKMYKRWHLRAPVLHRNVVMVGLTMSSIPPCISKHFCLR